MRWSLREFVNGINPTSFASVGNQLIWFLGSTAFTVQTVRLLDAAGDARQRLGMELAYALLFAWTGKSGISALSQHGKRRTDREYMRAKAEGEVAKAQAALTSAATVAAPTIAPVVVPPIVAAPVAPAPAPSAPARPSGAVPTASPEPDAWRDDERGELGVGPEALGFASAPPSASGGSGNWNALREARLGVMLHYDASTSDAGAVQWLLHDVRCKVSYNFLVLDGGEVVPIAPETGRAWHAGVCRPSEARLQYRDANSAFYGVSLAATVGEHVTEPALASIVALVRRLFAAHGWDPVRDTWRIVGHASEAWPRGRKVDPVGPNPAHPVMDVATVRAMVAAGGPCREAA